MTTLLFKGQFEHSRDVANLAVAAAREKRAGKGPISDSWDIEDHLTALKARIVPLRSIGTELISAAVHVHGALWPGVSATLSASELATVLRDPGKRLHAGKRSGVQAGADQVLTHVLSWYEGLDLDVIQRLRTISPWCTDPAKIQRRQEVAHRVAFWSNIGVFTTSLITSDSESDYEDDGETDETGDAEAEIPEDDDAATGAATETVASREAATPSPAETSHAEANPEALDTTANVEETLVTSPIADVPEKPASPTA